MQSKNIISLAAPLVLMATSVVAQEINGDEAKALCPDVPQWKTVVYNKHGEDKCWEFVETESETATFFVAAYDQKTGRHMKCLNAVPTNGWRVLFNISGEGKCWEEVKGADGMVSYQEVEGDVATTVASGSEN